MSKKCVYLDLETTGLNKEGTDEALEIAIVCSSGETLVDSLLKPSKLKTWPQAEQIHGISPALVQAAPRLSDILQEVVDAVRGRELIIYNASYDLQFLLPVVVEAASKVHCCMKAFAPSYGEKHPNSNQYRWQKLSLAAAHVGHHWTGQTHRALADAQATRSVWLWLNR